jgi:hypothetical protein
MTNDKVIEKGFVDFKKVIERDIVTALQNTMWDLVNNINVPIDTHNLWDSIGCGVYINGVLVSVEFPPQAATEPRPFRYKAGDPKIYYWGAEELEEMIIHPPAEILSHIGWCLYYVAAQPYSQIVEDINGDEVLREDLVNPLFLTHLRKS